jgi:hypothetical protein
VLTPAGPASGLILAPGPSGSASFEVAKLTGRPLTVQWSASVRGRTSPAGGSVQASGLTVSPAAGSLTVAAHSTATAAITISVGNDRGEGAYPVTFGSVAASGTTLTSTTVNVHAAEPGRIWPYYTNIGVTTDGQSVASDHDGSDYTYTANALATDGQPPGAYVIPRRRQLHLAGCPPGQLASIDAAGQTIPVSFPVGATTIGLRGSATDAGSNDTSGALTVTYTDGTTQQTGWTLAGGRFLGWRRAVLFVCLIEPGSDVVVPSPGFVSGILTVA